MRKLLLALLPLLLMCLACQPPAPPAPPTPGRVAVTGDSVYVQASVYGGEGTASQHYDVQNKVGLGWQAKHAQPRLTTDTRSASTSPDILVVEFGQNYGGGFTQDARNQMMSLVFTPHDATCIVFVMPHYAGTNLVHRRAIDEYRHWVGTIRPHLGETITVDWRPVVQANPHYLVSDGVHLDVSEDSHAPRAFIDLVMNGVSQCA